MKIVVMLTDFYESLKNTTTNETMIMLVTVFVELSYSEVILSQAAVINITESLTQLSVCVFICITQISQSADLKMIFISHS